MKKTVNTKLSTMKVILFMCLIGLTSLQAQNVETARATASIDFETEVIDFGTIEKNSDGVRVFSFSNTGNGPLIISDVKTSCGCTVPTYSKQAIMPGEDGEIEVKYDTKRLGSFSKTITVYSNANLSKKSLKIKGEIVAAK